MSTTAKRRNTNVASSTGAGSASSSTTRKPPIPKLDKKKSSKASYWSALSKYFFGKNFKKKNTVPSHAPLSWFQWVAFFLRNSPMGKAIVILVLAIVVSLWWNQDTDPATKKLLQSVMANAKKDNCFSHPHLIPSGRTQMASRALEANQEILRMPRSLLIWDLDAFRDPFVQRELFSARNLQDEPLEASVFLAAHLARLVKNQSEYGIPSPVMKRYLETLSTFDDYFEYHPVFWGTDVLTSGLKVSSAAYDLVNHYSESLDENYNALAMASAKFESEISRYEFVAAMLNVMTRSFGTGPLEGNDADKESLMGKPLKEELDTYMEATGVDLSQGSHSMVPVLDLYNHHGNPNVGFSYDAKQRAFLVNTLRPLAPGQEVIDSYGKHTEAHLFAKYGFVNGDGSDHTQASVALFHPVMSYGMPLNVVGSDEGYHLHAKRLTRYLQYDDGYEDCVKAPSDDWDFDEEAFEFKILKLHHLLRIANDHKRWMVFLTPRNPKAYPPKQILYADPSSSGGQKTSRDKMIPHFNPSTVNLDANPVMATCRLISLTHHDYNGTAAQMLKDNLETPNYMLPRTRDALQYREIMCMIRLSDMAFHSFNTTMEEHVPLVRKLNAQPLSKGRKVPSREWHMAHLKLAEMQALQVIKDAALSWLRGFEKIEDKSLLNSAPEYTIRSSPCPAKYQMAVLANL